MGHRIRKGISKGPVKEAERIEMIITIDDRQWQLFTFGRYIQPAHKALTSTELKVYNMVNVGYDAYQIGERLNIRPRNVFGYIQTIKSKGWIK